MNLMNLKNKIKNRKILNMDFKEIIKSFIINLYNKENEEYNKNVDNINKILFYTPEIKQKALSHILMTYEIKIKILQEILDKINTL